MRLGRLFLLLSGLCAFGTGPAAAAGFDASAMSLGWALPFAGMLASIAFLPLIAPAFWHAHFGKVSAFWAFSLLLPLAIVFGISAAAELGWHVLIAEFLPFTVIMIALFTISGGIYVEGHLRGTPLLNTGILALGAALASLIGTTGASMVLIRPLLRANAERRFNVHVVVFFIFCVSNIGGALSPIGDPPLFLGFLKGVDFFWPLLHLWQPTLFALAVLLALFFVIDSVAAKRERRSNAAPSRTPIILHGRVNILIMLAVIFAIIGCARLDLGQMDVFGSTISFASLLRDAVLLLCAGLSLILTQRTARRGNRFSFLPVAEVTKIFATIFITAAPVIAILRQGDEGALGFLTSLVTGADGRPDTLVFFWMTGLLSAILDNAPTYLVFFEMAGGDPGRLMGELAPVLAALSGGAVFMGALSYIGNAPNFMVRSIAIENGVSMPGFFAYMGWSCAILLPLFALMSWLFFS